MHVSEGRTGAGFTLLEVMMVVVIVGILATIAIPVFRTYQLRSKSAEAETNLAAIGVAEQSYFSEFGVFLAVPPEPPTLPGSSPAVFSIAAGFSEIGFAPEGAVYFSYGVAASPDASGYTADAAADIDSNGIVQFWGYARPDSAGALTPGQVGCNVATLSPLEVGPCNAGAGRSIF